VSRIRDRGYQRWEGARTAASTRWLVVARAMLRLQLRPRWPKVLLVLALVPLIVCVTSMLVRGQPAEGYVLALLARPHGTLLLAVLMAMYAGGGAVADDARAGAFQFYFSRPLTVTQYLVGKLAPVAALVAAVSLGPALVVTLVRVATAADGAAAARELELTARVVGLGALEALALAAPVLALSSLVRRRGLAQGGFAALLFVPWIIGDRFVAFTRTPWPALPSIPAHLRNVARFVLALGPDPDDRGLPVWVSLAALAAIIAGALALARRRVASAEVVGS
jgi:hypothetical protein